MTHTPINRVPKGVPTGGEFAEGVRGELAGDPVLGGEEVIEPGVWEAVSVPVDGYDRVLVRQHPVDSGKYSIIAQTDVDFSELDLSEAFASVDAESGSSGLSAAWDAARPRERAAYIADNRQVIDAFLRNRYPAVGLSDRPGVVECEATTDHPPTATEVEESLADSGGYAFGRDFLRTEGRGAKALAAALTDHAGQSARPVPVSRDDLKAFQADFEHQAAWGAHIEYLGRDGVDQVAFDDERFKPENIADDERQLLAARLGGWLRRHSGDRELLAVEDPKSAGDFTTFGRFAAASSNPDSSVVTAVDSPLSPGSLACNRMVAGLREQFAGFDDFCLADDGKLRRRSA